MFKLRPAYMKIYSLWHRNKFCVFFVFFFQISPTLIQKALIHPSGKNNASTELRWPSSVTKTKMSEKHHHGFVLNFPSCVHTILKEESILNISTFHSSVDTFAFSRKETWNATLHHTQTSWRTWSKLPSLWLIGWRKTSRATSLANPTRGTTSVCRMWE